MKDISWKIGGIRSRVQTFFPNYCCMPYTQVYGIAFIVSTKTDSFALLLHGH